MKTLIAVLAIVALTNAAAVTLATGSSYTWTVEFVKNSSNSSNADVTFTLAVPSANSAQPLTNSETASLFCVDIGVANYTLAADSTTLNAFALLYTCSATCTSLSTVYSTFAFYTSATISGTTAGVISGAANALATSATPTWTHSNNSTAVTVMSTSTSVTPTLATTAKWPNVSSTGYWRCYMKINTVVDPAAAITAATTTWDTGNGNATVKGAAAVVSAVLASGAALVTLAL